MRFSLLFPIAVLLSGCASSPTASYPPGTTLTGKMLPPVEVAPTIAQATKPPKPIRMVGPEYPLAARRAGISGVAKVRFHVSADGRVTHAKALSAPHPLLAIAAEQALLKSEFEPAERDGRKIGCTLETTLTFSLD